MTEPQPGKVEQIGGIVRIVQSITLTHVLVIALLIAIAVPTFILYRFVTDASLLNKWSSFYEEFASDKVACTLRVVSQRGAQPVYALSTGFAYRGSDRYTIGVILSHKPDDGDIVSYCTAIESVVDHLRDPKVIPTFPNSDEPMILRR